MPTELLSPGMPWTLVTNKIYALPAVNCTMYTDSVATFEQSNQFDFSTKQALTLVGGAVAVTGAYIRALTGTPVVTLKRA